MEMSWGIPDTEEEIEKGQFLDTPLIIVDKDTEGVVFAKCRSVHEFEKLNMVGHGSHGVVFRARDKKTGEIVALKKFKIERGKEDTTLMVEYQILSSIHHPSIVNVKEIAVNKSMPSTKFMVMEYIDHDLQGLMERTMVHPFSQSEVKCLMLQLFDGVKILHNKGVVHRDLKPSNLLFNNCGELKICNFGMARWFGSQPLEHTYEIVTLWYRAPELFGAKEYSTAIDMWSLGCIAAELLLKRPLFPGFSRLDQIHKICKVIGTPSERIWPSFGNLARVPTNMISQPFNKLSEHFPGTAFNAEPTITLNGLDLLNRLLTYDPLKRINVNEALNHPWFQEVPLPKAKEFMPTFPISIEGSGSN